MYYENCNNITFNRQDSTTPSSIQLSANSSSCYIVFESALFLLFATCRNCLSKCVEIKKMIHGSLLRVTQTCSRCHSYWIWDSQPMVGNIPKGNVSLSAAILFAGALPTKTLRVVKIINCCCISPGTFFRHQRQYLQPAICSLWKSEQLALLTNLRDQKKLALSGDGRADSPGHSAKYGSYTVIEMSCNKVLDYKLVQVCLYTC